MNYAIDLQNVTKRFGSFTAVDNLSLQLPAGQVIGFLGPNGAGKTTTIRMIMDILVPDSGKLEILGERNAGAVKDRIGYLPEERGLYRKMTVHETLRYFGKLKGLSGGTLEARIDEGLSQIGLQDWKKKKVEALSKGMSQKLQFILCIMHEPELVILDEPFSGLDPINADMLQRLMANLRQRGTTVIFSTHQMESAERLCDRIVLINKGTKVLDGPLAAIREEHSTRTVIVDGDGDFNALANLPGVAQAHRTAAHARLELEDDTDASALLAKILDHVRVTKFEVQRLNLQEIFVRLVGGNPLKENEAAAMQVAAAGAD